MSRPDWFAGDMLGLEVPAHAAALRQGGEAWLTAAFRAAGALDADNRVVAVTQCEEKLGGGTGRKLLLGVEYATPGPPTDLFVKFSRDYDDDFRDGLRSQMEPEVRFALLSRAPDFPAVVARCMYADLNAQSGTATLITERIPFGRNGIEPAYEKCLDYEIPDPLAHYEALLAAVARLAGAHKAGRVPEAVARDFPFDLSRLPLLAPTHYDAGQLQRRLARFAAFGEAYPRLVPEKLRRPEFIARAAADIPRFLEHEPAIRSFLHGDPDLIALCHWNANVDNGWFWRAADGTLACGLLDWGGVGQMSVAFAIYGSLSGAEPDIWERRLDELLTHFAAEYRAAGGPAVSAAKLKRHLLLMTAMMGLTWLMDAPAVIEKEIADLATIDGRTDPRFRDNENARMRLHMITMFLNVWASFDLGGVLDEFIAREFAISP